MSGSQVAVVARPKGDGPGASARRGARWWLGPEGVAADMVRSGSSTGTRL